MQLFWFVSFYCRSKVIGGVFSYFRSLNGTRMKFCAILFLFLPQQMMSEGNKKFMHKVNKIYSFLYCLSSSKARGIKFIDTPLSEEFSWFFMLILFSWPKIIVWIVIFDHLPLNNKHRLGRADFWINKVIIDFPGVIKMRFYDGFSIVHLYADFLIWSGVTRVFTIGWVGDTVYRLSASWNNDYYWVHVGIVGIQIKWLIVWLLSLIHKNSQLGIELHSQSTIYCSG